MLYDAGRMPPAHYLWKLRPYYRQTAGQLLLGSLSGIAMNIAVVFPAIALGRAIDALVLYSKGGATRAAVAQAIVLLVLGTLATELPRIGKRWWLMTANARIRASIRSDALRGVLAWPMARLNATAIGDVMARVIGDVETLGVGVREFIIETWDTLLFLLSFFVSMLLIDAPLTLLALIPVPFAMALAWASGRWIRARTTATRAASSALTSGFQEFLSGIRVLRLLGMHATAQTRIDSLATTQAQVNIRSAFLRSLLPAIYTTLMAAGVPLVFWLGGARVASGAWTVGVFVTFLDLFLRFTGRGFRVPQMLNSIQSGGAAYSRLEAMLAPAVVGGPRGASFQARQLPCHPVETQNLASHYATNLRARQTQDFAPLPVSLQHVTFAYAPDQAPVLADLSLEIPAGAFVAVTGAVGSGKSALAKALLGLYPLASGRVLGIEAPTRRPGAIGYLSQEPFLFSGTVRDNIFFDEPADPAQTQQIVTLAALTDDLAMLPNGLESEIGERGIRVSGGQRQRIALARASAHAPGLLVLDDPFSAVDVNTETQIIANLRAAFGPSAPPDQRATIMLCSHRLTAFPHADLVLVLDAGRIIERGTHSELMAAAGRYAQIYATQMALGLAGGA